MSLASEEAFINRYILEECEKMVEGLENILQNDKFVFFSRSNMKHYEVDKHGHVLMEFRGEKISGSLDFIKKIVQYEKIVKIKSAVERIEMCNKTIQPLLEAEIPLIEEDLNIFLEEMNILKPKYDKMRLKNIDYIKKKNRLQNQMIINGHIDRNNIDQEEVNRTFNETFPEFIKFHDIFSELRSSYKILSQKINNLNSLLENIAKYNLKIQSYFINKN